ncbi:MAG: LytTR family DNA-binding domain-containing protein [Saprospiraceae bacterium]|nr:LytTR family DNA-binding domain-containing protein [Saprospiraceae bacterium]
MKCIIIEDQPPAQRILKKYIQDYGSLDLVGTFGDAIKGLEFLRTNEVDLIFLDIHLPKLTGIDFLRSLKHPPSVILTTAYPDFALESYELDVVDYLLKPFSFLRFLKAVNKVSLGEQKDVSKTKAKTSLFIKSGYDHIKVFLEDILFIKSDNDYTEVYIDDKKLISAESLKQWLDDFPHILLRIHKSYLVNKDKIQQISSTHVIIDGNHEIPIGRAYKEQVTKSILKT